MLRPDAPFRFQPRFDVDLARWLWNFVRASTERHVLRSLPLLCELSYASLRLWRELAALPGFDFGYRQDGVLMAYRTTSGLEAGAREAQLLRAHGVAAETLDRHATVKREPSLRHSVAGSVYFPDDAQIVPDQFVKGLAQRAAEDGVKTIPSVEVRGFKLHDEAIRSVQTSAGDFNADQFILAAGTQSAALARAVELRLPIEAGKGYSITFDRTSKRLNVPLVLAEDRLAITPMGDRLRVCGTLELGAQNLSIDRRRALAQLSAAACWLEDVPTATDQTIVWSGLRPCTPDGLPLVGRSRRVSNLTIATGHAMLGVSLAPITGKLVSQLTGDEATDFPIDKLSPDRFGARPAGRQTAA